MQNKYYVDSITCRNKHNSTDSLDSFYAPVRKTQEAASYAQGTTIENKRDSGKEFTVKSMDRDKSKVVVLQSKDPAITLTKNLIEFESLLDIPNSAWKIKKGNGTGILQPIENTTVIKSIHEANDPLKHFMRKAG